jgi:hypothetical protein
MHPRIPYSIPATASGTNATATVTIAAPSGGSCIYIIGIQAGYDTALSTANVLTLTDGTTTFGNWPVFDNRDVKPERAIKMTPNKEAVISLPAQGTSGKKGYVNVEYYIG